jgi:hypothetical protein
MLSIIRHSISVLQDALERLKLLHDLHAKVCTVLQMHMDEMKGRLEPSTAPHFARGDKVTVITKNLFLRGDPNRKLRDRQLGPFTIEEQIGKHNFILKLPSIVRLHHVFHVKNLKPCSIASLRPDVPMTTPKGDEDEFYVSHMSIDVCIKSLPRRRGKYLLFMTLFNDGGISRVW